MQFKHHWLLWTLSYVSIFFFYKHNVRWVITNTNLCTYFSSRKNKIIRIIFNRLHSSQKIKFKKIKEKKIFRHWAKIRDPLLEKSKLQLSVNNNEKYTQCLTTRTLSYNMKKKLSINSHNTKSSLELLIFFSACTRRFRY